jgi:Holliday junction resolvase RusA-like endonuclease
LGAEEESEGVMIGIRPSGLPFFDEVRFDAPFTVPPDIVLDLPSPLSVNRTRKIDWTAYAKTREWVARADAMFLAVKRKLPPPIRGRYEIFITLKEGRIDADNAVKLLVDTVRRFGLVEDDDPKHLRRLTVEFGPVEGSRVTIRPMA